MTASEIVACLRQSVVAACLAIADEAEEAEAERHHRPSRWLRYARSHRKIVKYNGFEGRRLWTYVDKRNPGPMTSSPV
jgi:hypothetical protein